jgi:hypothetical protein
VFSDAVVLKFVPVMVIEEPTAPELVKPVMLNDVLLLAVVTVKSLADVTVLLLTVTAIRPVVAPDGTVTTSCVAVAETTVAVVPLNVTVLFAITVLKFAPVMVTDVPTAPLDGVKLEIVGDGVTSSPLLHEVINGTRRPVIPRLFKNCFLSISQKI